MIFGWFFSTFHFYFQVVGDTLFNMLRLGECEVLHDDKPCIENKIIRVEILDNPFSDIVLRISSKKKKSEEKQKQKTEEKKYFSFFWQNGPLLCGVLGLIIIL